VSSFDYGTIRALLIDIDDTVVHFQPGVKTDNLFNMLESAGVELGNLTQEETLRRIAQVKAEIPWWHWSDFIVALELNAKEFWHYALEREHRNMQTTGPEIKAALEHLREAGFRLYVTSNNPSSGILYKLSIAGLATIQGAPLFDQLLGATELHAMKWEPLYWKKVLAHIGLNAKEVAVVGDNPRDDLEVPQSIGISHTFLINRNSDFAGIDSSTVTHVDSFDRIVDCLVDSKIQTVSCAPGKSIAALSTIGSGRSDPDVSLAHVDQLACGRFHPTCAS